VEVPGCGVGAGVGSGVGVGLGLGAVLLPTGAGKFFRFQKSFYRLKLFSRF
jgi:hypothetical protein